MAITLTTTARNAMCDALVDLIDAGAAAGHIQIGTSAMATVLAQLTFNDPAFGAASTGVATMSTSPSAVQDTSADNTGTAAAFRIRDSNNVEVFSGTVGTSGADINFDSVSFVSGGTVTLSSMTVTVPAS